MRALMILAALGLLAGCGVAPYTRAGSTQADYDRELMECWAAAEEPAASPPADQQAGWLAVELLTTIAGTPMSGPGEGPDWARGERTTACMDRRGWIKTPWQGMEP